MWCHENHDHAPPAACIGPLSADRCLHAVQAAATTLGNLAASTLGCTLLLKTSLLSDAQQLLHQLLQRRDGQRLAALLGVLANAAAQPEGLKQMLKTQDAPGVASWSASAVCVVLRDLGRILKPPLQPPACV